MDNMNNGVIDMAGFFINDKQLVIEFGDDPDEPKSVALEFRHDGEQDIVMKVLDDRNFWTQIINALSAALTEKA